jgi:hypothetical protein
MEGNMDYFTVTVGNKAIVATKADDALDVEMLIEDEAFLADLMVLESDGKPIWDGEEKIAFRPSSDPEKSAYDKCVAEAEAEGDYEEGDDFITYLVPVTDPTDEDD